METDEAKLKELDAELHRVVAQAKYKRRGTAERSGWICARQFDELTRGLCIKLEHEDVGDGLVWLFFTAHTPHGEVRIYRDAEAK